MIEEEKEGVLSAGAGAAVGLLAVGGRSGWGSEEAGVYVRVCNGDVACSVGRVKPA